MFNKLKLDKNKHIAAVLIVSILVIMMVFAVPAQAMIIDSSVKLSGLLKEITITLNPNSNDKLPIKSLMISRNGFKDICYFDKEGVILTPANCTAIDVVKIEKVVSQDDKKGYSYGKNNNRLSYKVYISQSSIHPKDVLNFEFTLGNSKNPFSKLIVIG